MIDQQLQRLPPAITVYVQSIDQTHRTVRGLDPLAETKADRLDHGPARRRDLEFQMPSVIADEARLDDLEHVIETRLGEILAPGTGEA